MIAEMANAMTAKRTAFATPATSATYRMLGMMTRETPMTGIKAIGIESAPHSTGFRHAECLKLDAHDHTPCDGH